MLAAALLALAAPARAQSLPPVQADVERVGTLAPSGPFGSVTADQIGDVTVHGGHAYLASGRASACDRGGVFVADLSDPAAPRQVAFAPALPETVHDDAVDALALETAALRGDVLAVGNRPCGPGGEGGFDLYDVRDPAAPIVLARAVGDRSPEGSLTQDPTRRANAVGSVGLWRDGDRAYAVAADLEEGTDVDVFEVTNPGAPVQIADRDLAADFPQIVGRAARGGEVRHHGAVVKEIAGVQTMLLAYGDAGTVQLDVDDPAAPVLLADTEYAEADPETGRRPPDGNAHHAEFGHDDRWVLSADEDLRSHRIDFAITSGPDAGGSPADEYTFTRRIAALPGGRLNGPTVFGGYGCDADDDIPSRDSAGLRALAADEEAILVLELGPVDDPDAAYPSCQVDEKAQNALDKGYDGVLVANFHRGSAQADGLECGDGEPRDIVGVCSTHEAMHDLFGEDPRYGRPYEPGDPNEPDEGQLGEDVAVTATFDGWGYAHLFDRASGAEADTWALPEAVDARFAFGFGALSIHEIATDPQTALSYAAHRAGGFRVLRFGTGGIEQTGAYIAAAGSDAYGVEAFAAADGSRLIAVSDRDRGLDVLRYTGPGAVGPRPPEEEPTPTPTPSPTPTPTPTATADPAATPQPAAPTPVIRRAEKRDPRSVSLRVRRTKTRRSLTLASSGRLVPPQGVSTREACLGNVQVVVKADRRTVSSRPTSLRRDCTFAGRVTFRGRSRFRGSRITVRAVFGGNDLLRRARSPVRRG
ncbi:MAG: hypothetical protein AVDCRST_MAG30-3917 [uncultured Solirubrobacteraceae bacterium]|uniref:Alkaline phosphatase n=1 Tax=uncultured Solirubrobacteraceae bacterium TaxID=1162706 RepID=A0A6J4TUA2_9ACTN|nr:MAG: hypothetical protein AVDCRST_MAG30-3917 [uncultured Solirubrobacteraceae bacterium]